MDKFVTRIEAMENTAKERGIAEIHRLNENETLFVHWHHVKKGFEYFKVDKREVKAGVHNLDGFTDLTREEALELLK